MDESIEVESLSLVERIVLLCVTDATLDGDGPVDSPGVRARVREHLEDIDAGIVSDPNEGDVTRALNALGSEPVVEEHHTDTSPVGKGRPRYAVSDPEPILDALETDDRLADVIESVRE